MVSPGVARHPAAAIGLALSLLAGGSPAAQEAPRSATELSREDWFRVEIGGEPAGHAVDRERRIGDRRIAESELELTVRRQGSRVRLELSSEFVETSTGQPIEMSSRQLLGQVPLVTVFRFSPLAIEVESRQAEEVTRHRLPLPTESWLSPAAAAERVRQEVAAGARRFTLRTMDPLLGATPFEVHYERLEVAESSAPPASCSLASRWRQTSVGSGESTLDFDATGSLLRSVTPLLGLKMVLIRSSREEALAARGAPELLAPSLVQPDRQIPSPRRSRKAVYLLGQKQGVTPELPSAGSQRTTASGDRRRVSVEVDAAPLPAGELSAAERERYLAASAYLNHRDGDVLRLAQEAVQGLAGASAAAEAEALRRKVHLTLQRKDLDSAFATATEVADRRSGDCTEHAVLLAALLRARGIPSRVVVGLMYVERFGESSESFGYHMWTQAYLENAWVDLDAVTESPFDAAHIALATAALDDGQGMASLSAAVSSMLGSLAIEVVAVEP